MNIGIIFIFLGTFSLVLATPNIPWWGILSYCVACFGFLLTGFILQRELMEEREEDDLNAGL